MSAAILCMYLLQHYIVLHEIIGSLHRLIWGREVSSSHAYIIYQLERTMQYASSFHLPEKEVLKKGCKLSFNTATANC